MLKKPKLVDRMIAWLIKLSELGIKYEPRGSIKAQWLVDFVAKLKTTTKEKSLCWKLHVNGSLNTKGGGAGVILEGWRWIHWFNVKENIIEVIFKVIEDLDEKKETINNVTWIKVNKWVIIIIIIIIIFFNVIWSVEFMLFGYEW